MKDGHKIFVVRTIDGAVNEILDTYVTGVRDLVYVSINEAKRAIENRYKGCEYCLATDDKVIAEQYGIRLINADKK